MWCTRPENMKKLSIWHHLRRSCQYSNCCRLLASWSSSSLCSRISYMSRIGVWKSTKWIRNSMQSFTGFNQLNVGDVRNYSIDCYRTYRNECASNIKFKKIHSPIFISNVSKTTRTHTLAPKRKMMVCENRSSTCIQLMKSMNPNKMTPHRTEPFFFFF